MTAAMVPIHCLSVYGPYFFGSDFLALACLALACLTTGCAVTGCLMAGCGCAVCGMEDDDAATVGRAGSAAAGAGSGVNAGVVLDAAGMSTVGATMVGFSTAGETTSGDATAGDATAGADTADASAAGATTAGLSAVVGGHGSPFLTRGSPRRISPVLIEPTGADGAVKAAGAAGAPGAAGVAAAELCGPTSTWTGGHGDPPATRGNPCRRDDCGTSAASSYFRESAGSLTGTGAPDVSEPPAVRRANASSGGQGSPPGVRGRPRRSEGVVMSYFRRASRAWMSAGTTVNTSPTTPKSAISKMGASASWLMATMVLAVCMPARCWMAPEIPSAT